MKQNRIFLSAVTMSLAMVVGVEMSEAKTTFPAIFSDGMVVQAESEVAIWGKSDKPGKVLTLETGWDNAVYRTKVAADGSWAVSVATPKANVGGESFEINVNDGDRAVIKDVKIGEVWFCSGQSNMDMRVSGRYNDPVIGALDAIVTSDDPDVRMFTVGSKMASEALTECRGRWESASSATTPEFSATAYFFAKKLHEVLKVPVGIIHASYGGSRVEAWMSREAVEPFKSFKEVQNASILYNGMVAPVIGYGIRGVLWYQGEANIDAPDLYSRLLPAMVKDWRTTWKNDSLPFYYAQIAPFSYNKGDEKGKNSAYLREVQTQCLDLIPESGMICLLDVGDARTIHPMEKITVGNRFAYLALARTYGLKGYTEMGPIYKSMEVDGSEVTISFEMVGKGLTTYRKPLSGFEVAGEDRVFHPANAKLGKDAKTVVVSSKEVEKPVAVRYAFKDYVDGSLFNMFGLPASSFRSDDW